MNYNFPLIETLDDVLPHVKGRDEFVVAERDFGTVVNYNVSFPDTFDIDSDNSLAGIIRRECRGIIFDKEGKIMSRPFHKFFNIGQREETQPYMIDLSQPHQIVEKMDGSMIRPIILNGRVRLATKMGITDVSLQAERWAHNNLKEDHFSWLYDMVKCGVTPIFEWISPNNQIVVKYTEADLVYLCSRNTFTGNYFEEYNPPFTQVKKYSSWNGSTKDYVENRRSEKDREGDVIWFMDGHKVKMKNDWYCEIHSMLDDIRYDKALVKYILSEKLDDIVAKVDSNTAEYIKEFELDFHKCLKNLIEKYQRYYNSVISSGLSRKQFAINWLPSIKKNDPFAGQYIFGMFSGYDSREMILNYIEAQLSTNPKWEECSKWMGMSVGRTFLG